MLPSSEVLDPRSGAPRSAALTTLKAVPDMSEQDYADLVGAAHELEHTSFALQLTNLLGRQIGQFSKLIPSAVTGLVNKAAEAAIKNAFNLALRSLRSQHLGTLRGTRRFHQLAAVISGAAGGAFGLASLPVELPISTTIILRSIADIARLEGEDLSEPETLLACLQVFALGGRDNGGQEQENVGDLTESGYFATRGLLAKSVSEAARYLVGRAVTDETSPVLLRLLTQIGSRFGIVVTQKLAAQAIPVLGAAGGAAVNYAFVAHFQKIAHGHFTIRRLERTYGKELVHVEYERIAADIRQTGWTHAHATA